MTPTKNNETDVQITDREIIISRVFDAPRELVWETMTDPKKVVNWWGPRGFSTTIEVMDVRPGGEWKHVMQGPDGTKYPNHSIFQEIVKPERLVYSHSGHKEGGTNVSKVFTWTFDALDENRMRLTLHQVYPTKEEREIVVREYGAIEGGKQTLERLSEEVEKKEEEFLITREFDAPRELVWQMWTDPEHLARWWGPKGTTCGNCTLELRSGGMFHYQMKAPNGFEMWGKFVYREIVKPERMVFVSSFSDPEGKTTRHPMSPAWPLETLNILSFSGSEDKTSITLRAFPVNASEEERKTFKEGRGGMQHGFKGTFDHLVEHMATLQRK